MLSYGVTESALVVSPTEKSAEYIEELLRDDGSWQTKRAANGGEARRILVSETFDLIIINAPLGDEFGHELAALQSETGGAGVMLLVKSEIFDETCDRVEDSGVFTLSKPVSRQLFFQALRLISASRKRLAGLKQENVKLQTKIEEIRVVDRAKCTLIHYLKLTEPQAHRYIEKQAMDMRLSRREIAEGILRTYET